MIPEKISFRPGLLAGPMGLKIKSTGETPSKYLRRLVAEDCGTNPPKMVAGNPNFINAKVARSSEMREANRRKKAKRKAKR